MPPRGGARTAFRWTSYDVPFWARGNSRPGRWHTVGDPPTQYWSLDADAAWAELIRHEDLHSEWALDQLRMPFWICRIRIEPLVDLRDLAVRERYAVQDGDPVNNDWSACQALGERLRGEGVAGVLSPCAALPSRTNLTFFGARRAIDWATEPVLASTVPAAVACIGRPPEGLIDQVRRKVGRDDARLF